MCIRDSSYGEWEESWDTFLQGEFFLKLKDGTIYTPGDLKAGWGTRPEYDDAPEGQRTITETTIGFFDRVVDLDQVESCLLYTSASCASAAPMSGLTPE